MYTIINMTAKIYVSSSNIFENNLFQKEFPVNKILQWFAYFANVPENMPWLQNLKKRKLKGAGNALS